MKTLKEDKKKRILNDVCRVCGARFGDDDRSFVYEKGQKPICFFCSLTDKLKPSPSTEDMNSILNGLRMEEKKYPPDITEDLFSTDGTVKMSYPDHFGIRAVEGYNQAVKEFNDKLESAKSHDTPSTEDITEIRNRYSDFRLYSERSAWIQTDVAPYLEGYKKDFDRDLPFFLPYLKENK